MSGSSKPSIEKINPTHDCKAFGCGKHPMDFWLKRHAQKNQEIGSPQTYVAVRGDAVIGYYSLVYGGFRREDFTPKILEGLPSDFQVPVMVLARLAVDSREQRTGLGEALLKDALLRATAAAGIAGLRAVVVDAIDDDSASFFRHFGFEDSPASASRLMLLIDDIQASIDAG